MHHSQDPSCISYILQIRREEGEGEQMYIKHKANVLIEKYPKKSSGQKKKSRDFRKN